MTKFLCTITIAWTAQVGAADKLHSQWVYPDASGKLIYQATPAGDRIMDFSHAGYMGGGVALPVVPMKRTVKPTGADDAAEIQAAIDAVSALPLTAGIRGAVVLAAGTFICSNTINIFASGVVLRGSGSGSNSGPRTTIKLAGRPHNAITLRGATTRRNSENVTPASEASPARATIQDVYVPSGTTKLTVNDATGFVPGDTVEIRKPVTEAWIRFMQMHDLVRDGRPQTWIRRGATLVTERKITEITGKTITLGVPLSDAIDAKYVETPGATVTKSKGATRISQVGVEHLHIESPPQSISHTQSHFTAIRLNAEDAWLRDLVIDETMNSVGLNGQRITVQQVAVNRKAPHQGSSKPAEFAPNAGQLLLDRCSGTADNVWYAATGAGISGPIVLLNCTFYGNGRVETHQRWSTGMLYDNCRVPQGGMEFRNRGAMGSGHGWTMGWGVAWNCEAKDWVVQNPPGAVNWMIGCIGESKRMPRPFDREPLLPEGTKESQGAPVTPRSLYLAQLAERLGLQALKNIGYGP
jgi:hypothetical protein